MDSEITRNFDGLEGNALRNAPKQTLSLQTRYDITTGPFRGIGFGGAAEFVDERYGDDSNTFLLPSHTRIDLSLFYPFSERLQLDFFANNVFDEEIYAEGFSRVRVIQEPGRTYRARIKLLFH